MELSDLSTELILVVVHNNVTSFFEVLRVIHELELNKRPLLDA